MIKISSSIKVSDIVEGGENFNFPHYNNLLSKVDILQDINTEEIEDIKKGILSEIIENKVIDKMLLSEWKDNIVTFGENVSNTWKTYKVRFYVITILIILITLIILIIFIWLKYFKKENINTIIMQKITKDKITKEKTKKDKNTSENENMLDPYTQLLMDGMHKNI